LLQKRDAVLERELLFLGLTEQRTQMLELARHVSFGFARAAHRGRQVLHAAEQRAQVGFGPRAPGERRCRVSLASAEQTRRRSARRRHSTLEGWIGVGRLAA
jgi:hypothetical protein